MLYMYLGRQFHERAGEVINGEPMTVVRESMIGTDQYTLTYPNVSSCTTITVVLDDGTMIGVHLTIRTPENQVTTMLDKMVELKSTNPDGTPTDRGVESIVVVGALTFGGIAANGAYAYPKLFETLATKFGHNGLVWEYDQPQGDRHYKVRAVGSSFEVKTMTPETEMKAGITISKFYDGTENARAWNPVQLKAHYKPAPWQLAAPPP